MKVKAMINMFEGGTKRRPGDIFEVKDERVKQLGSDIEVVKEDIKVIEVTKNLAESPKDKMIKTPVKKK